MVRFSTSDTELPGFNPPCCFAGICEHHEPSLTIESIEISGEFFAKLYVASHMDLGQRSYQQNTTGFRSEGVVLRSHEAWNWLEVRPLSKLHHSPWTLSTGPFLFGGETDWAPNFSAIERADWISVPLFLPQTLLQWLSELFKKLSIYMQCMNLQTWWLIYFIFNCDDHLILF